MSDLDVFHNEFVPNAEGATISFQRWRRDYRSEYDAYVAFRDAILAGQNPTPPAVSSRFGKAMVAAGRMALSEPPSEPPRTTNVLHRFTRVHSSQFKAARNKYQPAPSYWNPPEQTGGTLWPGGILGEENITTPHGEGVKLVCLDGMYHISVGASNRIANLEYEPSVSWIGQAHQWDFYVYLPSAGNPSGYSGGFFEGYNIVQVGNTTGGQFGSTNGHKLWVTGDRRLRFTIRAQAEQFASTWFTSSPIAEDAWHHVRWELLHTTAANGYQRGWVNGTQVMNYTGPTIFSGESIWMVAPLQWYGPRTGIRNEIWFSEMQLGRLN